MRNRIISTVVLWGVVILALVFLRAHAAVWLIVAVSLLAQRELYHMLKVMGYRPIPALGMVAGLIIVAGSFYFPTVPVTPVAIVIATCGALTRERGGRSVQCLLSTIFGIVYLPFMLQYLVELMELAPNETAGILMGIWVVAVTKFSDVGALLVGLKFGKHKMAPKASPGKTWEGAVGGVTTGCIVGALYVFLVQAYLPDSFAWWKALFAAIPIGIIGVVSDLVESIIKRQAGVKDSGDTIPGIGGVFDLVDSLVLSVPVGYVVIACLLV